VHKVVLNGLTIMQVAGCSLQTPLRQLKMYNSQLTPLGYSKYSSVLPIDAFVLLCHRILLGL